MDHHHDDDPTVLLEAVEQSLERDDVDAALWLLRSIKRRLSSPVPASTTTVPGLTQREVAALALLPDASLSQKDMARVLGISLNTLKTHLRSLYQKLGVHSRSEAIERTGVGAQRIAVTGHRHLAAV
jgi:ATP/maltotriose-dependent transcriptional regulator MalT